MFVHVPHNFEIVIWIQTPKLLFCLLGPLCDSQQILPFCSQQGDFISSAIKKDHMRST